MIRMILIYTGLFTAAAIALWLRPSGDTTQDFATQITPPRSIAGASLAPVRTDTPLPRTAQDADDQGLASLVVQELEQDSSGENLGALTASTNGAVDLEPLLEVPGSIRNADGTRVLASALLRNGGGVALDEGDLSSSVSNVAIASSDAEFEFYVVQPGDSLASIALDKYGTTAAFSRVYNANRDILTTVDSIRVGQRLRLP